MCCCNRLSINKGQGRVAVAQLFCLFLPRMPWAMVCFQLLSVPQFTLISWGRGFQADQRSLILVQIRVWFGIHSSPNEQDLLGKSMKVWTKRTKQDWCKETLKIESSNSSLVWPDGTWLLCVLLLERDFWVSGCSVNSQRQAGWKYSDSGQQSSSRCICSNGLELKDPIKTLKATHCQ